MKFAMTDISKQFSEFKLKLLQQLNENNRELKESFNQSSVDIRKEISAVRNHVINLLLKENKVLRERCKTLASRVVTNEKRLDKLEQNHRKSNLEFDGIPANVRQEDLPKTVTDIVNTIVDEKISVKDLSNISTPKKTKTKNKTKDTDLLNIEKEMSELFGHKIEIETKNKKAGKVSISYKTLDELDSIISKIKNK